MPYPVFNLDRLKFDGGESDGPALTVDKLVALDAAADDSTSGDVDALGAELVKARNQGGATVFVCGAEVLRSGVSLHLVDLMEKGLLTHLCIEPAGVLCDWELASAGYVSPDAERQLANDGLIQNLLATLAAGDADGMGVGEALGGRIHGDGFPHQSMSLLGQGFRLGVPVTVHAAIGGAMLHAAAGFDPGCVGRMLHRDFLVLANSVENLDDGVVYQFGEANMAVEVFRTAIKAARRVAAEYQRDIVDFTTAVFSPAVDKTQSIATVSTAAAKDRRHTIGGSFAQIIPALRQAALSFAGWQS